MDSGTGPAQDDVVFETTAAQGVRACGRVRSVKAIGIARHGRDLALRAHVVGQVNSEVEAWLELVRERVVEAFAAGRTPNVLLEVVPFAGDEAAIFVDQPVLIGEMAWCITADAAQASAVFALAAELDGVAPLGRLPSERWVNAFLREVRAGVPFEPEFQPVSISEGMLSVFEGHYGWVTSYEQGWIATERFSAPCAVLPASFSSAAQWVRKVEAIVAMSKAREPEASRNTQCKFCKETVAPLDFNSRLEACHACAQAYCGVVY